MIGIVRNSKIKVGRLHWHGHAITINRTRLVIGVTEV